MQLISFVRNEEDFKFMPTEFVRASKSTQCYSCKDGVFVPRGTPLRFGFIN